MSRGKSGFPRLILTNPFSEIELPDLYSASPERIVREAEKYLTKDGKSRLLWACDKRGVIIATDIQKKRKLLSKQKKHQGREDFDRVKWRVMKKFFTRIANQKQHPGNRKPFQNTRRQFHSKKNGQQPIHSRMREGGNHGRSNKR